MHCDNVQEKIGRHSDLLVVNDKLQFAVCGRPRPRAARIGGNMQLTSAALQTVQHGNMQAAQQHAAPVGEVMDCLQGVPSHSLPRLAELCMRTLEPLLLA